ncbi:MAG: AAA family ATPase [Armatimonadetes bacterium]|nr:AAA family ATPase [Armatimonadota bacterium]
MITEIRFQNFRVLRDAKLQLEPLTVIVGPNGSGKSTVFAALLAARDRVLEAGDSQARWTANAESARKEGIKIQLVWQEPELKVTTIVTRDSPEVLWDPPWNDAPWRVRKEDLLARLERLLVLSPSAASAGRPATLVPDAELGADGAGLAAVLDRLRDEHPERFEALNEELGSWFPEFDRVLFNVPVEGQRAVQLRTRVGGHAIPVEDLSQGAVFGLLYLTLTQLPKPPAIICVEEPDHGLHPRLLRQVRDALHRLAYPQDHGIDRAPVQVIATTHSPCMLDLFRDHLRQVVVAEKCGLSASFTRLSDHEHIEEILADSRLGDSWYTGVLGGVPSLP